MERSDLDQWRSREVARLLALVETQRRYYHDIVACIPVGVLLLSPEMNTLLANGAARKIFGLNIGDSAGRMDGILPPALLRRVEEVLKTGHPQTGVIIELGTGRRRIRAGILAIRNWDDEAAPEALLTVEDVSELEHQPAAIPTPLPEPLLSLEARGSQQPAAAVSAPQFIDNVNAILWAVELPSMRFVFASRQAEQLLGFAPEHWINHASFWSDRVYDTDRDWVVQSYARALAAGAVHSCEFQATTAGKRGVWLREYARVLPNPGGSPRYLVGVAVDVSERRMLEDQLVQSERVDAVSRLAGRMAHELNNALMILTGYSEELLTNLPAGSTLRADVREILAATGRLSGLTMQLLSFARPQQGGAASELSLEATIGRFSPRLSALLGTHVGLELRLAPEASRIRADSAQLEQVVTALVERARQAAHAGQKIAIETSRREVSEELRRSNAPLEPGSYAVISVAAPAQPLDSDAKAALFECSLPGQGPWDEVAAALSRAYAIVRQWGGDISVHNNRRGETVFRVFLQRLETGAGESVEPFIPAIEAPPVTLTPPIPLATILVVEDEAGIRALVRKILRRQGYEVLEAANGQDALAICAEHGERVDLLITDVLMPEMGGRELVERLQTQGHGMQVLYVSGYSDDHTVYSGDLPPGTAFLQKPFTLGSLLDKVKEVLAK